MIGALLTVAIWLARAGFDDAGLRLAHWTICHARNALEPEGMQARYVIEDEQARRARRWS